MSRKIYATHDHNGYGGITLDATIEVFESEAAAREWLLAPYRDGGWDINSAVIDAGQFGDCWIKSVDAPSVGTPWISPFSFNQVRVERPGRHPGGRFYWTTPRPDVLVVASIKEA
jgi:hypothetical protein